MVALKGGCWVVRSAAKLVVLLAAHWAERSDYPMVVLLESSSAVPMVVKTEPLLVLRTVSLWAGC